ncbi:hypothetical protein Tco_0439505 [Tanacetum coccineum]
MAYSSTSSNSEVSSDSNCSSSCLEYVKILKEQNEQLLKDLRTSKINAITYKTGLDSIEARLLVYKKNKSVYEEDIKVLKREVHLRDIAITELRRKLEVALKQKDEIQLTIENLKNSSKIPPPYTRNFMPPKPDLSFIGLEEFVNDPKFSRTTVKKPLVETSEAKASADKPKVDCKKRQFNNKKMVKPVWNYTSRVNHQNFAKKTHPSPKKKMVPKAVLKRSGLVTLTIARPVNTTQPRTTVNSARPMTNIFNKAHSTGNPQQDFQEKGVIDSGCSGHMTRNMSYLTNFEENDGGYVAFGGNPKGGKITGRDHLGKFDGKADEGFFVGYSINRSGPNWIFDIDALTKSLNYKLVVAGNQSNGNADTKECDDTCKARMETVPDKDYIMLPLWTADPPFSQNSKTSPDVGFKPLGDDEKKATEGPRKEGGALRKDCEYNDQEKEDNVNNTKTVNVASPNEVNVVGAKTSIDLPGDPNMLKLEDIVYSDDDEDVGAEADMNNLDVDVLTLNIILYPYYLEYGVLCLSLGYGLLTFSLLSVFGGTQASDTPFLLDGLTMTYWSSNSKSSKYLHSAPE